jgi:hypothetical protein
MAAQQQTTTKSTKWAYISFESTCVCVCVFVGPCVQAAHTYNMHFLYCYEGFPFCSIQVPMFCLSLKITRFQQELRTLFR